VNLVWAPAEKLETPYVVSYKEGLQTSRYVVSDRAVCCVRMCETSLDVLCAHLTLRQLARGLLRPWHRKEYNYE
jgi:hypothetical protein